MFTWRCHEVYDSSQLCAVLSAKLNDIARDGWEVYSVNVYADVGRAVIVTRKAYEPKRAGFGNLGAGARITEESCSGPELDKRTARMAEQLRSKPESAMKRANEKEMDGWQVELDKPPATGYWKGPAPDHDLLREQHEKLMVDYEVRGKALEKALEELSVHRSEGWRKPGDEPAVNPVLYARCPLCGRHKAEHHFESHALGVRVVCPPSPRNPVRTSSDEPPPDDPTDAKARKLADEAQAAFDKIRARPDDPMRSYFVGMVGADLQWTAEAVCALPPKERPTEDDVRSLRNQNLPGLCVHCGRELDGHSSFQLGACFLNRKATK